MTGSKYGEGKEAQASSQTQNSFIMVSGKGGGSISEVVGVCKVLGKVMVWVDSNLYMRDLKIAAWLRLEKLKTTRLMEWRIKLLHLAIRWMSLAIARRTDCTVQSVKFGGWGIKIPFIKSIKKLIWFGQPRLKSCYFAVCKEVKTQTKSNKTKNNKNKSICVLNIFLAH